MGVLAAHTESGCCYYPVHWWQHKVLWLMQELISSLWVELCLGISANYPSLQCQSSSGSVGKSIWPEFIRLKFKSWLDLNFFLRQVILNVICILELWQGFAACAHMPVKDIYCWISCHTARTTFRSHFGNYICVNKVVKMATLLSEFCYF